MGIQFRGGAYAGLIADLGSIHSTIERKKEKKGCWTAERIHGTWELKGLVLHSPFRGLPSYQAVKTQESF